jgi:hypothetical protein
MDARFDIGGRNTGGERATQGLSELFFEGQRESP